MRDSEHAALMEEFERLRAERVSIQNDSRVVTCVFCGHQYPPGTPTANHEALRAHVAVCPKHPAAEFRQWAEQAEAACAAMREAMEPLRDTFASGVVDGNMPPHVIIGKVEQIARAALALSAGRDILAELTRLRRWVAGINAAFMVYEGAHGLETIPSYNTLAHAIRDAEFAAKMAEGGAK